VTEYSIAARRLIPCLLSGTFHLSDYFDYISGTSTGAIIATGLAIGMAVDDILKFYREAGAQMFVKANLLRRLRYKFEDEPLADKLREVFGADTVFGSPKVRTLLMMVMRNATTDFHRATATSNRHRRPVTSGRGGPKLLGAFCASSLRGAQNDAVRHDTLPHEPPQGDQKLTRQGHDHGLATAAGVLGAGSEPLRQGAVLLEHEKSPSQLDHAAPNPGFTVAALQQSLCQVQRQQGPA
jgi:hypothetical protein